MRERDRPLSCATADHAAIVNEPSGGVQIVGVSLGADAMPVPRGREPACEDLCTGAKVITSGEFFSMKVLPRQDSNRVGSKVLRLSGLRASGLRVDSAQNRG